ncbi:MAG: hypothetical protein AB7G80_06715 [Dongiaceae bacterium]
MKNHHNKGFGVGYALAVMALVAGSSVLMTQHMSSVARMQGRTQETFNVQQALQRADAEIKLSMREVVGGIAYPPAYSRLDQDGQTITWPPAGRFASRQSADGGYLPNNFVNRGDSRGQFLYCAYRNNTSRIDPTIDRDGNPLPASDAQNRISLNNEAIGREQISVAPAYALIAMNGAGQYGIACEDLYRTNEAGAQVRRTAEELNAIANGSRFIIATNDEALAGAANNRINILAGTAGSTSCDETRDKLVFTVDQNGMTRFICVPEIAFPVSAHNRDGAGEGILVNPIENADVDKPFEFRRIQGIGNVSVTTAPDGGILIQGMSGEVNARNIGATGQDILNVGTDGALEFRRLEGINGLTIFRSLSGELILDASGAIAGATELGVNIPLTTVAGEQSVFAGKVGNTFQFRKLVGNNGINLTNDTEGRIVVGIGGTTPGELLQPLDCDPITQKLRWNTSLNPPRWECALDQAGGGGTINNAVNGGGGQVQVFRNITNGTLNFRSLTAGPGIALSQTNDVITIGLSGAVGGVTVGSTGSGARLVAEANGPQSTLTFRSLAALAGGGLEVSDGSNGTIAFGLQSCAEGQILGRIGGTWQCQNPPTGGGDGVSNIVSCNNQQTRTAASNTACGSARRIQLNTFTNSPPAQIAEQLNTPGSWVPVGCRDLFGNRINTFASQIWWDPAAIYPGASVTGAWRTFADNSARFCVDGTLVVAQVGGSGTPGTMTIDSFEQTYHIDDNIEIAPLLPGRSSATSWTDLDQARWRTDVRNVQLRPGLWKIDVYGTTYICSSADAFQTTRLLFHEDRPANDPNRKTVTLKGANCPEGNAPYNISTLVRVPADGRFGVMSVPSSTGGNLQRVANIQGVTAIRVGD